MTLAEHTHQFHARHRRIARWVVPLLFLTGGSLVWGAEDLVWRLTGAVLAVAATVWVMELVDKAAKLDEKTERGEVLPENVARHLRSVA